MTCKVKTQFYKSYGHRYEFKTLNIFKTVNPGIIFKASTTKHNVARKEKEK